MATLKSLIILAILAYAGVLALMYVFQRSLMYFPDRARTPPAAAGLPQAEEVTLTSADGERLIAWYVPPQGDKPLVIYFHGNGGALNLRADRFRWLTTDGFGSASGCHIADMAVRPASRRRAGMLLDASAAYDFAAARYPAGRIVLGANRSAPVSPSRLPPNANRRTDPRCAVQLRRRHWGFSLSFHTGPLVHQGFLPVGRADRESPGTAARSARRAGPYRAYPVWRKTV